MEIRRLSLMGAVLAMAALLVAGIVMADGWDPSTAARNRVIDVPDAIGVGGITNTRHNLTMGYNGAAGIMDPYRNDYVEVCVYCHTPHGANRQVAAPLWNRTIRSSSLTSFTLYNQPTMTGQPVTNPGPNSLTCLSCHDGYTAIDSIINMPTRSTNGAAAGLDAAGPAGYSASQELTVGTGFLNAWNDPIYGGTRGSHVGLVSAPEHSTLPEDLGTNGPCYTCHQPGGPGGAPDFGIFLIGQEFFNSSEDSLDTGGSTTDEPPFVTVRDLSSGLAPYVRLNDDHPVGVRYPDAAAVTVDYNEPNRKEARMAYFDVNANGHADTDEVRLYDSGDGYEVECGSCHDPHGVRVTPGSDRLVPSFLRVGAMVDTGPSAGPTASDISANDGSRLCLTCHAK